MQQKKGPLYDDRTNPLRTTFELKGNSHATNATIKSDSLWLFVCITSATSLRGDRHVLNKLNIGRQIDIKEKRLSQRK